jgi:hypothetical protein
MSESHKGIKNPMFRKPAYGFKGHKHTEESRLKMRESRMEFLNKMVVN